MTPPDIFQKLVPSLSESEKKDMLSYYTVYEKYAEDVTERATEDLQDHPVFGTIISSVPKEISKARNQLSLQLQKDAIVNGNWPPYIEYQVEQGIGYAKMGLDFKSWYEVVALVKDYITPYLIQEYGSGRAFLSALNGMNRFMDVAMGIIGEAYMEEKKAIIRQANELLSSIYNTTTDIIFVIEVDGDGLYKFSSVNKSFQVITGLPYEGVVGKYVNEIIPGSSLDFVVNKYKEAIDGKTIVQWEGTFQFPAATFTGEVSVAPVFEEGKCIRLVGSIHDVTERKRTEEEIIKLNADLEQKVLARTAQFKALNKELEAFTYSVSHDLRAPLRAVNGYAEMLIEDYGDGLDEEATRILKARRGNSVKMGTLIDDLLAFSRIGRTEMQKKKVDMNVLLKDVVRELDRCVSHNARIKVGKLHTVKADHNLLRQAVFNLVSNGVKYSSKQKKPEVEIFSEEKNGEVIFSVKDNGAGFDMRYYDKLFGVFQRLHEQEEFEGTGVGLAIVNAVITRHGGKVWAEGTVNEGAVFHFSLQR